MAQHATLYRKVTRDHLCPFGLKSRFLLKKKGYAVDDHPLRSNEEAERFKQQEGVETTPQTFIGGKRIGGYDDLKEYFGLAKPQASNRSYRPVLAIFAVAAVISLAFQWRFEVALLSLASIQLFIASSMVLLALQKLRDIEAFTNQFITYDLIGMRYPPYAAVYPYLEALAGVGMIATVLPWVFGPIAVAIGAAGGVSVFKAVYVDKRKLTCACVGGDSKVPLGFVSLTENIFMVIAGCWMLAGW